MNRLSKTLFVKTQQYFFWNLHNTMDEYAYLQFEVRTKREPDKIYSFSFRKCFIVIYSHKYVNLLEIIIKDDEMKR